MDWSWIWKIAILTGALLVGVATRFGILKWKNDNYIEEVAEQVIESQTGVQVDLTPATPDPDMTKE